MDTQKTCFDCHGDVAGCVFYRCNVCEANVCWDCILNHHPVVECPCPKCGVVFPEGALCNSNLICSNCSADIVHPKCQTCPIPHLTPYKVFECSVCKKEGCGVNIKMCGFISGEPGCTECDKFICFDCGYGCMEECDLVRCSFEHADKCQECGCSGMVRCGQCRRQIENDRGSICIDCINEIHPGTCRKDGDKYDYEWVEETDERYAHWDITPKKEIKEEKRNDEKRDDEKRDDEKSGGFWDIGSSTLGDELEYYTCDD